MFCCLGSRAVHLELIYDVSTDSTVNGIRRFQARRGAVKRLMCDCGSNFVGAKRELVAAWSQLSIGIKLAGEGIQWDFIPPKASHHGGVYERLIRTVRRVFEYDGICVPYRRYVAHLVL